MRHGDSEPISGLGALIRGYRHEAGLTQQELATKAGLSLAALRDFEQCRRRRPRPSSLAALADAFGLTADQAAGLASAAAPPRRHRRDWPAPPPGEHDQPPGTADAVEPGGGLWVAILGPLEVWRDGTPLALGPPARRAVLGLLAMDAATLVRRETIIDVLWGDNPPRTALGLVQAHVSRLRKAVGPRRHLSGDAGVIDSASGSYRLKLSGEELDLLAFRDLTAGAAAARADGDDATACELYEQAMGLWRGEPLVDVELLSGHPGVTLLRQQLTTALLRYAEVACNAGRYHKVLPRLQALAAAEPLNEPAHTRLMIALAGTGQQAAAISVYEDLRGRLDSELGLYPGEELSDAHLRVLRQDIRAGDSGSIGAPRPASRLAPLAAAAATGPVVPRQLPAASRQFTGRSGELAELSGLLARDPGQASGVVIAALTGMPGIGKTALAVSWAHQVADQFPDGQLFADLGGFSRTGSPVTSGEAVRGFLTALGVPAERIPADAGGQAALYRSLLAGRRVLVVLDNAQDAEHVRPLLPGSPDCLVLVTSRNRLTGLVAADGAHLLTLGVLTDGESRDLLTGHLGPAPVAAEPAAVGELIDLCAGLPLALGNVAASATARPALPLEAVAAEMRDPQWRLDALETGEQATSVRMVFAASQARLGEPAGRMFRLLGMHAGPDISVPAAASLAGLPRSRAYLALAELCNEHLLTEPSPGRYGCHALLRAFAAEETCIRDSDSDRDAAVRRVLDYYLHTADRASGVLYPCYTGLTRDQPRPGVLPEEITDSQQAAEWFEGERQVLLATIDQAAAEGFAPHAWQLPYAAGLYFRGERPWRRLAAAQETALTVAAEAGDLAGQVLASYHLGLLRFCLGEQATACRYLDQAIELAAVLGDQRLCGLVGFARVAVLQLQDHAPGVPAVRYPTAAARLSARQQSPAAGWLP